MSFYITIIYKNKSYFARKIFYNDLAEDATHISNMGMRHREIQRHTCD